MSSLSLPRDRSARGSALPAPVTTAPDTVGPDTGSMNKPAQPAALTHRRVLFVCGAKRRLPIVFRVPRNIDLPRLTTYRTIFDIRLAIATAFVDTYLDWLATVWTARAKKSHPRAPVYRRPIRDVGFRTARRTASSRTTAGVCPLSPCQCRKFTDRRAHAHVLQAPRDRTARIL